MAELSTWEQKLKPVNIEMLKKAGVDVSTIGSMEDFYQWAEGSYRRTEDDIDVIQSQNLIKRADLCVLINKFGDINKDGRVQVIDVPLIWRDQEYLISCETWVPNIMQTTEVPGVYTSITPKDLGLTINIESVKGKTLNSDLEIDIPTKIHMFTQDVAYVYGTDSSNELLKKWNENDIGELFKEINNSLQKLKPKE